MFSGSPDARRLVVDLRDERPVWVMPEWALDEIRDALPAGWEAVVVDAPTHGRGDGGDPSGAALAAVPGAEIYLGHGFPLALFEASRSRGEPRLRWVHSGSAGVASSLYPEMRESDVLLTNSAGIYAAPMAETAIAMILHFARGLDVAVRAQAERRWAAELLEAEDSPAREIAGASVGIVGFGGIGREIARRVLALGMRVVALKRTPGEGPPGVELLVGAAALPELLRESDYLVLALPGTSETRGLIGPDQLDLLRPEAVVVNVGRGGVVDESALADRLRDGRLRGAALDVFETEPLSAASPLWDLPNTLLTPHSSGVSRRYWRRETDLIVENIRRYLDGRPLLNLVDKHAGY